MKNKKNDLLAFLLLLQCVIFGRFDQLKYYMFILTSILLSSL